MSEHVSAKSCSHSAEEENRELVFYFVGLVIFLIALFVRVYPLQEILYTLTLIVSGYHIIISGFIDTYERQVERTRCTLCFHILMKLASIGAVIIGEFMEAALLILIFAGAHFLEHYAEDKSNKEISNLLKLNPTTARRIKDNGEVEIVSVSELNINDELSILNGDQIPTDGVVISGASSVDQSAITGESIPVEKVSGDDLFGGTINRTGTLTMQVTKSSSDTVIAKIVELVSQSQNNISRTAALIKRVEPIYVTIVLLLTPVFFLLGLYAFQWTTDESFYRTMVFLIATSPCALAATDIPATLSAISHLAKRGVLFKGGSYLSNVADLKAVAFDKTGTLTTGNPVVTDTYFAAETTEEERVHYLQTIVSMESKSNHPLAQAVIKHFTDVEMVDLDVENMIGIGLVAKRDGISYKIGKPSSYETIP